MKFEKVMHKVTLMNCEKVESRKLDCTEKKNKLKQNLQNDEAVAPL